MAHRSSESFHPSRRIPSPPQQLPQHPNPTIHVLLLHQERRQESHHRILRAVKQHALGQPCIHNWTRWNLQLNPLYKSPSAHFLRRRTFFYQPLKLVMQIRAHFVHVLQQLFFFHNRQKFQRHAARHRTSAKRRAMLPRRNRRRKLLLRQKRAQWQPRRNRLGNRHNIRTHAQTLERTHRPRTPQSALNLVLNQRRFVTIRQSPALPQKFHRALVNSALAKTRLQNNRARIVIHRSPQSFHIFAPHKRNFFQQRLKSLAMFFLPGQRQPPERAPVIRTIQRHQSALRLAASAMSRQPRQLDRSINRLSPTIREKRACISNRAAQKRAQR